MVKLLVVDACGTYPCQMDMFAIHHFMKTRRMDNNGIYITCANITREKKMYGSPNAMTEVYNPMYEPNFWHATGVEDIFKPRSPLGAIITLLAIWQCVHRCFGKCFHSTHTRPLAACPFLKCLVSSRWNGGLNSLNILG